MTLQNTTRAIKRAVLSGEPLPSEMASRGDNERFSTERCLKFAVQPVIGLPIPLPAPRGRQGGREAGKGRHHILCLDRLPQRGVYLQRFFAARHRVEDAWEVENALPVI